ncbi:BRCT domain-containing protein [Morchella conica CCBAS932]|uniref:BRCT domain-containing protein n=1 Tax=Morchella conica CCBAS932 TaxID=1392247 RepID=A0A3N4KWL8_9PEZI|nr:BRCT domain-containing protein [Morchella conica CCBAS932]
METTKLLTTSGATPATPLDSHIRIDLASVTHIVSTTVDFPGYTEAERFMIPVVTPAWVTASLDKGRMVHVRPYNPDPRFFFSGVMATVAELPEGDKEAICGGVVAMGGQYTGHLTRFTTHVVALNMDNDKCRQALRKNLNVKIVLPHWFDDCLKLARRIPEDPYLLPDPEITRVPSSAPIPLPQGPDLTYSHDRRPPPLDGASEDPPTPRPSFSAFDGKSVFLAPDLDISLRLRGVLGEVIQGAGGAMVSAVEDASVLVCQFRAGTDYKYALRRGLEIGNLTWLYWIFAHSTWASPLRRLLHFPLPPGGVPGMQGMIITVSNYGGDARLYLENLVEACGARFTKSMKAENTHLVTAREHSEKCTAAREWNINMVNHLWLEECYAKGTVMSLANRRYAMWPPRTNLMEVVGMTGVDVGALEEEDRDGEAADAMSVDGDGDGAEEDAVVRGASGLAISERKEEAPPPPPRQQQQRQQRVSTPSRWSRDIEAPQSVSSSGRKAKEAAAARLHDSIMPDVMKYQQELKRKGGVMGTGRKRRTGSFGDMASMGADSGSEGEGWGGRSGGAKKVKVAAATAQGKRVKPKVFLLLTAYKGWVENPGKEESDKRGLAALGIQCVADPAVCTHLAAPHIVRTEKFCCALARAPIIVSTSWISACLSSSTIADTTPHLLHDPAGEQKLNMVLSESLSRARANAGKLLAGQTIYCAPNVHGGFETYRKIVEANGGVCVAFRMAKRVVSAEGKGKEVEEERWVLLSSDEEGDRKLWGAFARMVKGAGGTPVVVKTDWLLDAAMGQRVRWEGG